MKKSYFKKSYYRNITFLFIVFFFSNINFYAQCVPTGMVDWNDFNITNVTITGDAGSQINNNTPGDNAIYANFTSQTVNLTAGNIYTISVANNKQTWGNLKVRAWIDYLGNGTYTEVFDSGVYVNNGASSQTLSGTFTVSALAASGTAVMRVAASYHNNGNPDSGVMSTDGCNFINRAEIEDYTLNITALNILDPLATNDDLNVFVNSIAGIGNQIDVSGNDNIGTSDGTDGDDYALTSASPTVNGGTISEISDGVFEYIPAADFIGTDSFTYDICDAAGDCASATVNVTVTFGQCIPTSSSTSNDGRNLYLTNVNIPGDTYTLNNTSLDNGGYADYTGSLPALDLYKGTTYPAAISGDSNPNWVKNQVYLAIFLDLNHDGDFDDADETLVVSSGWETTPYPIKNFTVPATALNGLTVMRVGIRFQDPPVSCDVNTAQATEYEDYLVEIKELDIPTANDDDLSVSVNSTSGIDNEIDVSTNDALGSDGGDLDNYTLTSVSPTVNGGVITEVSDGVFEYVPGPGYIGTDSFTYEICDADGDCTSATVNVTVTFGYCIPTYNGSGQTTSNGNYYIDSLSLTAESSPINNMSGDDGGYGDYTSLTPAVLYKGLTYDIDVTGVGNPDNIGLTVYFDLNGDGVFDANTATEMLYNIEGTEASNPFSTKSITIPTSAITGLTVMRVGIKRYWSANNPCDSDNFGEFEDYLVDLQIDPGSGAEMDITANSTDVLDGSLIASVTNLTDFGVNDIFAVAPLERTFTITNNGGSDLNLTGAPIIAITGSPDFTISVQPTVTTLTGGSSTTFVIAFNPSAPTIGTRTATISIANNDANENPYTFVVEGYGDQTFPDTDDDGIPDNIDLDDDNDGLTDEYEQNSCTTNPGATTTNTVYLNEDFESGTNRDTIDGVAYCWEDGIGTTGSCNGTPNLGDGEYVVYYQAANGDNTDDTPNGEVASWADVYWYPGLDHTPGDTDGRMAMFNADFDPGIFYETTILGVSPGVDITYGFSAINLDRADAPGIGSRERPRVLIEILDPNGALITSSSSGLIAPTSDYVNGDWVSVSATFNTTFTSFTVRLSNQAPGGLGNDLAIDDIFVEQTLCDLDGDGVEDSVDLDNDDDGIPNVVELQLTDDDKDGTVNNDSGAYAWVDINNNGLIDIYDPQDASGRNPGDSGFSGSLGAPIDLTNPIYDTDGDGVVDYLDLDSDNDGIFDAVEYDNRGDVDVDGDGNGDGSDKDILDSSDNPIANDDFDGDGILSLADNNDDDADDSDHGTANAYPTPLDDDGDGIPNYRDVDSADDPNDFSNGSDIDKTQIYAHLDADNDGILDDTVDTDGDGILDIFDTDNTVFGSPRDLDDSYTLFFDGRNDYVEDSNVLASGAATIMGWIRSEGANVASSNRIIFGQDEFYVQVNHSDNTVTLMLNGSAVLTSTTAVTDGIWIHVAATTSASETVLYINGEAEGTITSGGISADASSFSIGRLADTDSNYFHGEIDEVRVFNAALTEDELQKMVYQELDDTNSFNSGKIIPLDINATVGGGLQRYYKMDAFSSDITEDKTTSSTTAKLYNIKDIYFQTAPLPYETIADGDWATQASWLYGDVWDITDEANNKDWSIVHVKHDLTTSNRHGTVGLLVDSGIELEVNNNVELQNSWYLSLDGRIDLQGESQLIQTETSILIATGELERDQQGTENLYTYNYWSSPVHTANPDADIDGNETYTVGAILSNGADPNNLEPITFVGGGNYDGDSTASPIEIADYWIWKYDNRASDSYYLWQHVRSTNTLLVGEGYTMKGPGTGAIATDRNYAFTGTPNNGEINLYVDGGSGYLVGNPYPSAIDGAEFLSDNTHLNGTLYFWEHYGGGSHILKEYQGGYGLYNYSGGTPAIDGALATPDPNVDQTGGGTKIPKRYIPVGQGFFVDATSGANIKFENDQRIFVTEAGGTNSLFFKDSNGKKIKANNLEDLRPKIRIGYTSPMGYKRQLLVTADENASMDYDWGYEGALIEENLEDMYWKVEGKNYIIQGINDIDPSNTVLPLGVKIKQEGIVEIAIDSLENVPENLEIYIKDKDNDLFFNLRESKYLGNISEGSIDNRFEIVFSNKDQLLNTELELEKQTTLYFDTSNSNLVIVNPKNYQIDELQLINTLGQIITTTKVEKSDDLIEIYANLKTGIYIAQIRSSGFKISKKFIINN